MEHKELKHNRHIQHQIENNCTGLPAGDGEKPGQIAHRTNKKKSKWHLTFLMCLFLLHGFSQEDMPAEPAQKDSVAPTEMVPLNEVLIAAGESRIRSIRMGESLISPEQIQNENRRNDSILVLIDSALSSTRDVDYGQKSQRFLTNEKNYWQTADRHVENQKSRLSGLVRQLQDQQVTLEKDLRKWRNTERMKDSSYAFGNIPEVIASTSAMLDSLATEISRRMELLIAPLNKTITTEVEIELLLEKIQLALSRKSSLVYAKTAPALFETSLLRTGRTGTGQRLETSLKSEWNALFFYFSQNRIRFVFFLLFLVGVLVLFSRVKRRLKLLDSSKLGYYEDMLRQVLQKPLSAGLLFSLFFTVGFFPDRPPLLVDLTILAMLPPLLDITLKLTPRKMHGFLWGFALLLLIFLGIRLMPPEILLYRYTLLGLGVIALLILWQLYRRPVLLKLPSSTLSGFVRFLVAFHLLASLVGVVANILGYTSISQVFTTSFITNALAGLLLYICAVILIGGLQILVGSRYMKGFRVIRDHEEYLKGLISRVIIIAVTLFWLDALLRIFYVKEFVYEHLGQIFTHTFMVGSMSFSLGKILLFVFIIWFSIILSRVIKIVLRADVFDKLSLKKGIPRMITAITQFALITIGILMAVRAIGMPLDQLTIILSAFSVGIGFGLQNIFNNLVSGVILLFEREVQLGDIIEVKDLMGKVTSMGIRSSHIQTFDGAEVIVPNGLLISQEVIDWTLSDKSRRIEIISGVAYGSDVHLVKKLLMQVISEHPEVKQEPKPLVLFNEMGESSLDFRLLFWTAHFEEWLRIRSEVIFAIHDILYENGISIPFPQRDLHLKSVEPSILRDQAKNSPQDS